VGSDFSRASKLYVEADLTPGEYHILGNLRWEYNYPCSFVFSTYSNQNLPLEKVQRNEVPDDFLIQFLSTFAFQNKKTVLRDPDLFLYQSLIDNDSGYGFLHFVNDNPKENIKLSFQYKNNKNWKQISGNLIKSTMDDDVNRVEVFVQRKNTKTVVFELDNHIFKDLVIENYQFENVLSEVDMRTSDPNRDYLARNLENFKLENINENISYFEYITPTTVYIIVRNNSEKNNYKIKLNPLNLVNLTLKNNLKTLTSRNFDYFELNSNEANKPINYEFTLSIHSF